jgi:hypothetical protein
VNTLTGSDDETLTYVFENADTTMTNLTAGQVIAYESAPDDVLVIKVGSVTAEGTALTIVGQNVELEEAFAAMKLEQSGDNDDMEVNPDSEPDEGVTFVGFEEADVPTRGDSGFISDSTPMHFKVDKDKVEADIQAVLSSRLSFYISLDYRYLEFCTDFDMIGEVTVPVKFSKDFKLGDFTVNLWGIKMGFTPKLHLEFSSKITLDFTYGVTLGFAYENGNGFHDLSKNRGLKVTDLNFDGSVFIGVDLQPTVSILSDKLLCMKLKMPAGFEIKGKTYENPHYEDIADYEGTIHYCDKCVEMETYFKIEFKVELKFLNLKFLTISGDIARYKSKIDDFYYSVDLNQFGFGLCPNKSMRVTVVAENENNIGVGDVPIVYIKKDEATENPLGTTNQEGLVSGYLQPATYTFRVTMKGQTYEYTHTITEPGKITLGPNVSAERSFIAEKTNPADYLTYGVEILWGS